MVDIWRENTSIRFGCIDRSDRLTLWSIFSFFQEAAISHALKIGVGRDVMQSSGQGWVLSRLSLFVERRPVYGETIEISSGPRGWEKLFALRDYLIRDAQGNEIVRGRGAWIVLDIEKRRPLRAQSIITPLPHNEGIDAFSSGAVGLNPRDGLIKSGERVALYSDIDYSGHMNNARYIQWMQDITDIDVFTNAAQIRLDINYLSEVLPGETVEIWTAPIEADVSVGDDYPSKPGPSFAYEGRKSSAGAAFRAELYTS